MPNEEQPRPRTTDERIDATAMNLELFGHELTTLGRKVDKLYSIVEIDAGNETIKTRRAMETMFGGPR